MKRVFIGSSTKALDKANTIKMILTNLGADVTLWSDDRAFTAGNNLIDELQKAAHQHDAGIFVLNDDDLILHTNSNNTQYIPRDNVLIESGIFIGALGKKSVALCTVPGIHETSDFKGILTIEYSGENFNKMKNQLEQWYDQNVVESHTISGEKNVLMLPRYKIHERFSIDDRLHISDGLYKQISHIRLMNFASNLVLNPKIGEIGHLSPKGIQLSDCIEKIMKETEANVELILTQPNKYNLIDLKTKISNHRAGSSKGALYSALATLYKNLSSNTIYAKRFKDLPILFHLYAMKTSMPFAIFNVEFWGDAEKYNHVKVDLYSAELKNEDDRRSFIIWQTEDPENYDFFVNNFSTIQKDASLCEKIDLVTLKKWAKVWNDCKPGGKE